MKSTHKKLLKIGEVARISGLSVGTLLNYEQQRLLKPSRSKAGHRRYKPEEIARLQFIKRANLAGLTLREVKDLLTLIADGERGENIPRVQEVVEEKLQETEWRMQELAAFRDSLLSYRRRFEEIERKEGES